MRPKSGEKLNARQLKAIDEYLTNGFRKGAAMRAAGYAESTCRSGQGLDTVFANPEVKAEIARRIQKATTKYVVTQEWIVERMAERADAGRILAPFKRIGEDGRPYWDFSEATPQEYLEAMRVIDELSEEVTDTGRKIKIKAANPDVSLLTLARHKGMLNDKLEVTGEMSLVERLQRGRLRVKPKTE